MWIHYTESYQISLSSWHIMCTQSQGSVTWQVMDLSCQQLHITAWCFHTRLWRDNAFLSTIAVFITSHFFPQVFQAIPVCLLIPIKTSLIIGSMWPSLKTIRQTETIVPRRWHRFKVSLQGVYILQIDTWYYNMESWLTFSVLQC